MFLNCLKKIKRIISKKKCCFCNAEILNNGFLCSSCENKIKIYHSQRKCVLCNRRLAGSGDEILCRYCKKLSPMFDQAIALYSYTEEFERALLRMKFDKVYSKVIAFSELMTVQFEKMNVKCDFIVPVPTVMMNYIIRDYCTSCELSYKIAKKCFMKVYDDMLIKKKNIQQSALKFEQRYTNVFGMYVFNSKYKDFLKGKSVLLVDDVITSGATVSECAKVLKENGAARVYAVALLYGGDRIL